ncbi:TM221 protein, partial [Piprites chloris]|nr:TM221 protein [Piprites chloris]
PAGSYGALPTWASRHAKGAAAGLAALCLVLNLSCLLLCLLHGHLSAELCRGQPGHDRADRFLQDNRRVRHAALGLFCFGIASYLTGKGSSPPPSLGLHMLLVLGPRAGIPAACFLFSGILLLLLTVSRALLQASRVSRHGLPGTYPSLDEDDPAQQGLSSTKARAELQPCPEIHREFPFPVSLESKA